MIVLCIDATAQLVNFEPVQEHTVVLQEGATYEVSDTFYMGPYLFYILKGSRNAYDSQMFMRVQDQAEQLHQYLYSSFYETFSKPLK